MENCRIHKINDAVTLRIYTAPHFKTMKISVNMLVPLSERTAASYGILPCLVTRATREYPDFISLNRRLSELYGATLGARTMKLGGFQCLSLFASGISNRYAFGGDDMLAELTELLFSAMFSPFLDENGLFPEENFLQEQRQLLELKDSEFNDKITYAHQRCEELLLAGQAAQDRYGSREQIAALDRKTVSAAWKEVLSSARFEVFVLGDCDPSPELFRQRFSAVGVPVDLAPLPYQSPGSIQRVTEEQAIAQSKLSIGFRVDSRPGELNLFQLMSAVLGGTPSSKLFQNVREKMGLCYYCSSMFSLSGRSLYVESGVETANLEKAEQEIFRQLQKTQAGEITEEELLSAKLAMCNSFRSIGDSLQAVETWYLGQLFSESGMTTPEEAVRRTTEYTAEQVAEAARRVTPAVVYVLRGRDDG